MTETENATVLSDMEFIKLLHKDSDSSSFPHQFELKLDQFGKRVNLRFARSSAKTKSWSRSTVFNDIYVLDEQTHQPKKFSLDSTKQVNQLLVVEFLEFNLFIFICKGRI